MVCSTGLPEFGHKRIMQSSHDNYFNVCRQHIEDDNYQTFKLGDNQLWGVILRILSYFLLVAIIKPFIRPPQGLLFLVVKLRKELRLSLLSVDCLN